MKLQLKELTLMVHRGRVRNRLMRACKKKNMGVAINPVKRGIAILKKKWMVMWMRPRAKMLTHARSTADDKSKEVISALPGSLCVSCQEVCDR
jgi:hypothetical protein